jgi:hypothetical protein
MKHTKLISLSQDEIIARLTPVLGGVIYNVYHADEDHVQDKTYITIKRETWLPANASASTIHNLQKLVSAGKITYLDFDGYCLSESYLIAHGYNLVDEQIAALTRLYHTQLATLSRKFEKLYEWNRLQFIASDKSISNHWGHNVNEFEFIQWTGTYHDYEGIHKPYNVYPIHRLQGIDDIVRWNESTVQAIEHEFARLEYRQDLANRKAYHARLAA